MCGRQSVSCTTALSGVYRSAAEYIGESGRRRREEHEKGTVRTNLLFSSDILYGEVKCIMFCLVLAGVQIGENQNFQRASGC